jgi:GDP-L-fucose synthase
MKIFIAGHRGLVGSALARFYSRLPGWTLLTRTRQELDLADPAATLAFLKTEKPDVVIDAAARVGGIKANNDFPVDFLLENLKIQNSLIEGAHLAGVGKFLFLGSSCIYPKLAPQPMAEEALLTGLLEPTNEPYAIAKITGIKLCQAYRRQYGSRFISAMPTNLYGPHDNFDPAHSHVLPGLIFKFHHAKTENLPAVTLWGTGIPRREFMHCDDVAAACHLLVEKYEGADHLNIGTGEDVTIREAAELIRDIVGYTGRIEWDASMPDGTPRKLLDVSKIKALGWEPRISLADGLRDTYRWYLENT